MTSSERVKAAMAHREPDRVPMHINASSWVVQRLLDRIKLKTPKELLEYLNIDVYDMRGIDLHSGTAPVYNGPGHRILKPGKEWGGNIMAIWNIREYENETAHGPVLEIEKPPFREMDKISEFENYPWPSSDWFNYSILSKDLEEWNDFSIMASGGSVFQHASYLRGLDQQLIDLMMFPESADFFLGKLSDFYLDYYRLLLEHAGEQIDVLAFADDFGTQSSLLISPDTFEEYFASRLRKMANLAHEFNCSFLLHTCGNVESLIPRFIDIGIDVLDPIQPESLDPERIKKLYGKEICLRGGISSQQVLAHGKPEDVELEVKKKLDIMMPDGGYIFSPGHPVLQVDIPTENILTMYETAFNYGKY